jgi:hypothetical protein
VLTGTEGADRCSTVARQQLKDEKVDNARGLVAVLSRAMLIESLRLDEDISRWNSRLSGYVKSVMKENWSEPGQHYTATEKTWRLVANEQYTYTT